MKQSIEQAAEQLALENGYPQSDKTVMEITYWGKHNLFCEGVITGINSDWNKADKIQAQIDVLNDALNWTNEMDETCYYVQKKITQLQEQLKLLNNE